MVYIVYIVGILYFLYSIKQKTREGEEWKKGDLIETMRKTWKKVLELTDSKRQDKTKKPITEDEILDLEKTDLTTKFFEGGLDTERF